jgi:hypothetical protein
VVQGILVCLLTVMLQTPGSIIITADYVDFVEVGNGYERAS